MRNRLFPLVAFVMVLCMAGCTPSMQNIRQTNEVVDIYPDYKDVTIPVNIAPLDFEVLVDSDSKWGVRVIASEDTLDYYADANVFSFDEGWWKDLLSKNAGQSIQFVLCEREADGWKAYQPFSVHVAEEIDPYMTYRLIPPGYSLWKEMGIYQRHLESFEETAVYKNEQGKGNCVNCHSFCNRNPERMLFHFRSELAATYLFKDGRKEKLDTKTDHTLSALVYPYWHPSGDFVVFSVNKTFQFLHMKDPNRIEVCDDASDVVVYDVNRREVFTSELLNSTDEYETFPTFSPDGKSLYYCSAHAVDSMPQQYQEVKYSLCKISFDEENRTFGTEVDTLYNASLLKRSVSFPRMSPDGRLLVYTLSDYGNFSIWHKDADLYMVDLATGDTQRLDILNSDNVESYHSWSSNSRWLVFSSRRENGLYTQPYIAYIDENGSPRKPFLLPQRNPKSFYEAQMNAYNIPELVNGKIEISSREIADFAINETAIQVK